MERLARPLAWSLWAVAIVLAAVGGGLVLISLDVPVADSWGVRGFWDLVTPFVATPGLLVARRQRGNAIGWILLVAGVSAGFSGFVQEYATRAVVIAPGSLPGAIALAWVASWTWGFFSGPLLTLLPQLFPTGRPLGRRWVPLLWCGVGFIPGVFVLFGLRPGPAENAEFIDNPLALGGALADARVALEGPLNLFLVATVVASVLVLGLRFHRARGTERQQLKWVAGAAALVAFAAAVMVGSNTSKPSQIVLLAALMTLPVAIGVAITRYRLYDIDIIVNRALVYGATSVAVGVAFFVAIVVLQALLRPFTGGSEIAVAASTLLSTALFQPLRHRVQGAVDRRFYRSRYDAARTLDAFSVRLRDEVDLDAVRADLIDAVERTVQPAQASVWLRATRS